MFAGFQVVEGAVLGCQLVPPVSFFSPGWLQWRSLQWLSYNVRDVKSAGLCEGGGQTVSGLTSLLSRCSFPNLRGEKIKRWMFQICIWIQFIFSPKMGRFLNNFTILCSYFCKLTSNKVGQRRIQVVGHQFVGLLAIWGCALVGQGRHCGFKDVA